MVSSDPALHERFAYLTSQYMLLAHKCARKLRRNPDDHDDLVQEAFLALYKAIENYAVQGKTIDCEPTFVTAVFRRAMFRHAGYRTPDLVELSPTLVEVVGHAAYFDQVFTEEYLSEIGKLLGGLAQSIVQELLLPGDRAMELAFAESRQKEVGLTCMSTRTIAVMDAEPVSLIVFQEGRRARPARKGQRYKHRVRVTGKHVRIALGLSAQVWGVEMAKIREFTKHWLDMNGALQSC